MKLLFLLAVLLPCSVYAADATGVLAIAFDGGEELANSWVGKIISWGTHIIGVASIVTAVTPTKKDNAALAIFKTVLQALAFNFKHAKDDTKRL